MKNPKIIVFTCNWNAYRSLDKAAGQMRHDIAKLLPLKVSCLDRLGIGNILKPFEKGADGILLLGCAPGECHFRDQTRTIKKVFGSAKQLSRLLGYGEERLQLAWISADDGKGLIERFNDFAGCLHQEPK